MLNGHAALTPEMAIRFEQAFGVSAATLLRMQSAHNLVEARRTAQSIRVERIPEPV
jgi:plasmid maintenance system antidote protein VapI